MPADFPVGASPSETTSCQATLLVSRQYIARVPFSGLHAPSSPKPGPETVAAVATPSPSTDQFGLRKGERTCFSESNLRDYCEPCY